MPKPSTLPPNMTAAAAAKGYRRQVDVLRALEQRGIVIPQPVLSGLFRGTPAYPKVHNAVAELLDLSVDELLKVVAASGESGT